MKKIKILNTEVLSLSEQQLLECMTERLSAEAPGEGNGVLITPNLDHLVKLQKDREFYDIYCRAEWVTCDSKILCLCSRMLKDSFPQAIPGSGYFTAFYKYNHENPNCRIFLLGAMDGVAKKAMERINTAIGRELVVGAMSPSYGFEKKPEENELIYRTINESGANVVLVGVGAPKQEKWIFAHKEHMPEVKIWMALGATIDFEAGNIQRAPKIYQKLAMEWFYRFLKEPKRMFRRYFIDDMKFFWYFGKQLLGIYKDPFSNSNL